MNETSRNTAALEARIRELEAARDKCHRHLNASQRLSGIGSWEVVLKDKDTIAPGSAQWSAEVFRMLGYAPGEVEVSVERFLSHVHPEDRPAVEQALQHALQNCTVYDVEHRLLRRDGSELVVQELGHTEMLEPGSPDQWIRLVGTVRDVTARRRSEAELRRQAADLRDMMDQLSIVREEERYAIAREIHDELGQQLSMLKMGVHKASAALRDNGLEDPVTAQLLGGIDEAIKAVRRIASDLRPIILEYEGLAAALKWYASEFEKLHDIPVVVQVALDREIDDKKIALTLFRILQESFTNIIRHAAAQHVWVTLKEEGHVIHLRIADDGVGFDPAAARDKKHFGLISMSERVALVGGTCAVEANTPRGTLIRVTVPSP